MGRSTDAAELDAALLAERARRLAEVPPEPGRDEDRAGALLVQLGSDPWGLSLCDLVAVERHLRLAPIPAAPPVVAGLAVRLGRMLPVFDLRVVLGAPLGGPALRPVVVVGQGDDHVGLIVDRVAGSIHFPSARLVGDAERPLVLGTTADGVPILDVQRLLGADHLVVRSAGGGDRCG